MENIRTNEITGGALLSAVAVTLMYVLSFFPSLTLTAAAFAGFAVMVVLMKWGKQAAFLCFFSASLLSMLLIGNKEAPLMFLLFFGYYPMFKLIVEQWKNKWIIWAAKLALVNAAIFFLFFITKEFFTLPTDFTKNLWFMYWLVIVTFIMYDIAFTNVIRLMLRKWKKRVK